MLRADRLEKRLIPWILAGTLFVTHLAFMLRDRWAERQTAGRESVTFPLPPSGPGL